MQVLLILENDLGWWEDFPCLPPVGTEVDVDEMGGGDYVIMAEVVRITWHCNYHHYFLDLRITSPEPDQMPLISVLNALKEKHNLETEPHYVLKGHRPTGLRHRNELEDGPSPTDHE